MSEKHSGSIEKELRLAREQLHRFTGAINSCSDAIRITDMQGKLLYQNAAFTNMFGYTSEELNRSGGIRAVYDDPDMYSYVLRTALERQNWQGKVKMRHRDGHSLMIDIQTNTVHDVTGNTIGLVGVHHDITPIQEAEAALEFLSRTAMGFVELSLEENLFAYIARELNNLVHNAIVIVSSFDSNNNRFTIRALNANENWVKVLEDGLGLPLLGLETRAENNFLKRLQESRLLKIQSGLYQLSNMLLPRQLCLELEKKLEIEDIQVIGFSRRGTLLGTASLLVVRGGTLVSPGLIETFANQASVAIERRRVGEQLLEREKQLAVTLESIGEGVIAVDTMGKIQLLNPAAETITGWSSHEAREQPLVKVFPLLDPASNSSGKLMAFKDFLPEDGSGERRFQNLTLLCDNQVRKIIAGTISRMLGSNQQILGFTMVFQDITEQQQHQTQQALSQKLESIGQLAAGIAHEINTPMQYVGDNIYFMEDALSDLIPLVVEYRKLVNECELVGNKIELVREIHHREQQIDLDYLQEELPRALEQSREGIDRVRKLVLTMKDFAHPSSGIKAFADLNKGVQSTIQISINEWKYYAELQAELSPNLPLVYCVIDEINQAVLNLIVNSTHAIRDAVNTGRYTKGLIQVKTRQEGDDVAIEIADNGGGIPAEVKYLIFDPFFTTKDVGKGTGQGLTITHDIIVNKHGGRITLESEENKGTRFTLYLPVKEEVGSDE
ncbi:MAG: PAS domain S-box protein [Syntrophomonadaceae bacterium]|nr:PAS domain S-box protein [Syntrophomonadaceae bacterium]